MIDFDGQIAYNTFFKRYCSHQIIMFYQRTQLVLRISKGDLIKLKKISMFKGGNGIKLWHVSLEGWYKLLMNLLLESSSMCQSRTILVTPYVSVNHFQQLVFQRTWHECIIPRVTKKKCQCTPSNFPECLVFYLFGSSNLQDNASCLLEQFCNHRFETVHRYNLHRFIPVVGC